MCPLWLLVAVMAVGVAKGAAHQCWDHISCQEVSDNSSLMECIQLCQSDIIPGDGHLQPPPPPPSSSSAQDKRSYSMGHFRWGKPVGRKRRPLKGHTSVGVEGELDDSLPAQVHRRQLVSEMVAAGGRVEKEKLHDAHQKKDNSYKMKHFRWSGPPGSKRHDGFLKLLADDGQETTGGGDREEISQDTPHLHAL